MKKIIFFSKNLNIGGMEKALTILLNELSKVYNVTLVLEEKKGILLGKLNSNIEVKEYKINQNKNVIMRKSINFFRRIVWALKNYHKYDFSCNYATYSFSSSRLAQIASKKSTLYVHSNYYDMYNKNIDKITSFFNYHKIKNFSHIVFVSNESKESIAKIFSSLENKMIVINNLIDYKNILIDSTKKAFIKIDKNKKNFIFIGRLENESKNLKLLINSFLQTDAEKNVLYIVGNGPYQKEILKMIKPCKNIKYVGEMENPYPLLKLCDCLILTSNYEGYPVVYNEALVLKKDIMTTVLVSDGEINIKDYAIKIEKDVNVISQKLNQYKKTINNNNINFDKINFERLKKIKKIIEE